MSRRQASAECEVGRSAAVTRRLALWFCFGLVMAHAALPAAEVRNRDIEYDGNLEFFYLPEKIAQLPLPEGAVVTHVSGWIHDWDWFTDDFRGLIRTESHGTFSVRFNPRDLSLSEVKQLNPPAEITSLSQRGVRLPQDEELDKEIEREILFGAAFNNNPRAILWKGDGSFDWQSSFSTAPFYTQLSDLTLTNDAVWGMWDNPSSRSLEFYRLPLNALGGPWIHSHTITMAATPFFDRTESAFSASFAPGHLYWRHRVIRPGGMSSEPDLAKVGVTYSRRFSNQITREIFDEETASSFSVTLDENIGSNTSGDIRDVASLYHPPSGLFYSAWEAGSVVRGAWIDPSTRQFRRYDLGPITPAFGIRNLSLHPSTVGVFATWIDMDPARDPLQIVLVRELGDLLAGSADLEIDRMATSAVFMARGSLGSYQGLALFRHSGGATMVAPFILTTPFQRPRPARRGSPGE